MTAKLARTAFAVFVVLLAAGCATGGGQGYDTDANAAAKARGSNAQFAWNDKGEKVCLLPNGEVRPPETCVGNIAHARDIDDEATLASQSKLKTAPRQASTGQALANAAIGAGIGAIACNVGGRWLGYDGHDRRFAATWCAGLGGVLGYAVSRPSSMTMSPSYYNPWRPGDAMMPYVHQLEMEAARGGYR